MTSYPRPVFCLDFLGFLTPVIVKVEPHADPSKFQTAVWDLPTARAIQGDMERRAAEYERDADQAEREGRVEIANTTRAFASYTLTAAADLLAVLQSAEERKAA